MREEEVCNLCDVLGPGPSGWGEGPHSLSTRYRGFAAQEEVFSPFLFHACIRALARSGVLKHCIGQARRQIPRQQRFPQEGD